MAAFEAGTGVPNTTDRRFYSHYFLPAGIEHAFGLRLLGDAARARRLPI